MLQSESEIGCQSTFNVLTFNVINTTVGHPIACQPMHKFDLIYENPLRSWWGFRHSVGSFQSLCAMIYPSAFRLVSWHCSTIVTADTVVIFLERSRRQMDCHRRSAEKRHYPSSSDEFPSYLGFAIFRESRGSCLKDTVLVRYSCLPCRKKSHQLNFVIKKTQLFRQYPYGHSRPFYWREPTSYKIIYILPWKIQASIISPPEEPRFLFLKGRHLTFAHIHIFSDGWNIANSF